MAGLNQKLPVHRRWSWRLFFSVSWYDGPTQVGGYSPPPNPILSVLKLILKWPPSSSLMVIRAWNLHASKQNTLTCDEVREACNFQSASWSPGPLTRDLQTQWNFTHTWISHLFKGDVGSFFFFCMLIFSQMLRNSLDSAAQCRWTMTVAVEAWQNITRGENVSDSGCNWLQRIFNKEFKSESLNDIFLVICLITLDLDVNTFKLKLNVCTFCFVSF